MPGLQVKYGNKLRYILFKDLEEPFQANTSQQQVVAMKDTEQQQELLKDGWIGERIEQQNNEWYVVYIK